MTSTQVHLDFSTFNSRHYLNEYYSRIGPENATLLRFLAKTYKQIFTQTPFAEVLELGGGPTIYQLISLSQYPVKINFTEYLEQNRREIQMWLDKHPKKFPWRKYFHHVRKIDPELTKLKISRHENMLRQKIVDIRQIDIRHPQLPSEPQREYDIVSSHFVAESITANHKEWQQHVENIANFVKPGGNLLLSSIIQATKYRVGHHYFPAIAISSEQIKAELQHRGISTVSEDFVAAETPEQGYAGLHILHGKKLANQP